MEESQSESGRNTGELGGLRVLLVEDEAFLAEVLVRCFTRRGHFVRAACSVIEAEVLVRQESFDCGVFDVEVGSEDGIALAERLLTGRKVGVAVFFSGTASGRVRKRAAAVGAFVHKEEHFAELLRVVEGQARTRGAT
ncbi:MAG TPA: response regulator [Polyangiaceae bacterium]